MKVTSIAKEYCQERRNAVELLEAIGLENVTSDITALNGNLRFKDPKTGAIYYLNEKSGKYSRRPDGLNGSACPVLNRSTTTKHWSGVRNCSYSQTSWIIDRDINSQACRVAKIAIGYRKFHGC